MKQKSEELNQLRIELELSKKRLDDKEKLEREFFNKHQINSSKYQSNIQGDLWNDCMFFFSLFKTNWLDWTTK